MKKSDLLTTFLLIIFFQINLFPQKKYFSEAQNINSTNSLVSKKAGIAFRTDDNQTLADYQKMDSIFTYYNSTYNQNYHFSIALNFGRTEFENPSYINMLKTLQNHNHEIMDHTPDHRTNYFPTSYPASTYKDSANNYLPGIDHVADLPNGKRKVCLKFKPISLVGQTRIDTCSVSGNKVTGNFSSFNIDTDIYVYLVGLGLNNLYYIYSFNANKTEATITNVWLEDVNLPAQSNINFYKFSRENKLTNEAIQELAKESLRLAAQYQIERPYTWVQPGGRWPIISTAELSTALIPLGYTAGSSFGDTPKSLKVFNEYDPNNNLQFGLQWEDFNEDKTDASGWSLANIKNKIADGIAKHKVIIGHNHFYEHDTLDFNTKPEYFAKVDGILSWCNTNNIDVKTYNEWANILYEQTPNPYENIFPPLNVDLDENIDILNPKGVADGYVPRYKSSGNSSDHGIRSQDNSAPSEGHFYYSVAAYSRIFLIQNLAGVEKGENEFEIWTKGSVNDKIRIYFRFAGTEIEYWIPADTPIWTKYSLANSVNGNTILNIPDNVSTIEIELKPYYYNFSGDSIKVSGMALYKKKPIISANLKVNLEGAFSGGTMETSTSFQNVVPTVQPFNIAPWTYAGTETFTTLPANAIDWVLVELRSGSAANTMVKRKAGLVKNDGTIINADDGLPISFEIAEGNYYVVIYHRNHLPIMSATPVTFQ
ncbi:MAG: hypothetical protein KDC90_06240 [Ignavibacteriae bacterium]|nr:hypothetical protein [Ignavibacteriota bacterium]